MNTQIRLVLAAVSLALLNACASMSGHKATTVVGTWINSTGTVLTLNADNTFEVDLTHHGRRDIWGTYSVNNDTFAIEHNEGKVPKHCQGRGVYKFKRDVNMLAFTLVSDSCRERRMNILKPWHMK